MPAKFYLTTPLYYVNSKPHIGHSYTQIAADVLARYHRLTGKDVLFLTGTDEHGQKVAKAAEAAGESPQVFTDRMTRTFEDLWKKLNIEYDDYIRTTEKRHVRAVQEVWKRLQQKGELYTSKYSGWYCIPCETFWTEGQIAREGNQVLCPDCRRPVEMLEEENYFFKMSAYQKWLTDAIRAGSVAVRPDIRKNEVLGFLDNNVLQDLCISRPKSRLSWGISSPLSEAHVTYVWFDALINYISACGWPDDTEKFGKWWPVDVHIIGKDILRHHAVYWPILLHALGLQTPKMIFAHGWWVQGGEKMSKSRGNVTDPSEIAARYGVDAYRYFLLRETPFGSDGTFSEEALILRYNTDLANDLGNLLHRTLTMCEKYFNRSIPIVLWPKKLSERDDIDIAIQRGYASLRARVSSLLTKEIAEHMKELEFEKALTAIWTLISQSNKFIEESAPWKLAKEARTDELKIVIVSLMEVLKAVSQAVWPFMPSTAEEIWIQLGLSGKPNELPFKMNMWGFFDKDGKIAKGQPLFPRIETEKV